MARNRYSVDLPDLVQPIGITGALQAGFDSYMQERAHREQREQQRLSNELQQRRVDMEERRAGLAEQRDQRDWEMKTSGRNQRLASDLSGLVADGRLAEADVFAKGSQYMDPQTGQMRSLGFDRGGERFDPDFEPLQLKEPTGDPSAGLAALMGKTKAPSQVWGADDPEAQGLRSPDFSGLKSMLSGDVTEAPTGWGKKQVAPSMTTPDGQRVEFAPDERAQFKDQQARAREEKLIDLAGRTQDPALQKILLLNAGLTGAQANGAERSNVTNVEGREDAQAFKAEQGQIGFEQKKQLKAMGGAKGAGKGQTSNQKSTEQRGYNGQAATLLNQELTREGYKQVEQDLRDTELMLKGLDSDNPAAQKRSLGIWAKQASGPGAVQQSERDEFVNTVGGQDQKVRAMALKWLSDGEAPPEQRKIFSAAAKDIMLRHHNDTMSQIQEDVGNIFATHPDAKMQGYATWARGAVGRKYGGGKAAAAPNTAKPSDKGAGAGAGETKTIGGKTYTKVNGVWHEGG